jgi:hypothetical protein
MTAYERMASVRDRFARGEIAPEELRLHLEPILGETAADKADEEICRGIANDIERLLFTQREPERSALIRQKLESALDFVGARSALAGITD